MKFLFVAMGPGETSQGRALAKYVHGQGHEIIFGVSQEENRAFLEGDSDIFTILLIPQPNILYQTLQKHQPDVLVFCNSKTWNKDHQFQTTAPQQKPLTVCLDSNWLFDEELYPFFSPIVWSDQYLINIPPEIYRHGLKEHGGNFSIAEKFKNKIKAIGFIPSYDALTKSQAEEIRNSLGVRPEEKLIFLYGSGWGADYRGWMVENLNRALRSLKKQSQNFKAFYVGPPSAEVTALQQTCSVILSGKISAEKFYHVLAASDLVFQHQGLATLAQAISARVPVIANVTVLPGHNLPEIMVWEVEPFAQSGACYMHIHNDHSSDITAAVEKLLFDEESRKQMQSAQATQYMRGEEQAYQSIVNLVQHPHL